MREQSIWLGRDEQRHGPYSEATLRQRLAEGQLAAHAMAWREGLPGWIPVGALLERMRNPELPPAALAVAPADALPAPHTPAVHDAAMLPPAPALPWPVVMVLKVLTFGLFGMVWSFVQANWIRRVDRASHAALWLVLAYIALGLGLLLMRSQADDAPTVGGMSQMPLVWLLLAIFLALLEVACFLMANSLRRAMPPHGLVVPIGTATLLVFSLYYLQAQLLRVARWQRGAAVAPVRAAPFWILLLAVLLLTGLAAIVLPAWQQRALRAQVRDAAAQADGARLAVSEYFDIHGAMPVDTAAAGIMAAPSNGPYVSALAVEHGRVVLLLDGPRTATALRGRQLVFTPQVEHAQVVWNCDGSTVPTPLLPPFCAP